MNERQDGNRLDGQRMNGKIKMKGTNDGRKKKFKKKGKRTEKVERQSRE